MEKQTRAYQARATSAVQNRLFAPQSQVARAIRHPWMEGASSGTSRLQIFEVEGNLSGVTDERSADNSVRDLLMDWTSAPEEAVPGQGTRVTRRIIIVEDLIPRIAELLGVRLDIPPEFFLAHCDEFVNLSIVDATCTVQSGKYWRVPIPQRRALPVNFSGPYGIWHLECGVFGRQDALLSEAVGSLRYMSHASCWATTYGDGSWTILVLLDPHQAIIRRKENPSHCIELQNYPYLRKLCAEVFPSASGDAPTWPDHRPIFDALVKAHSEVPITVDSDPFSGTTYLRNLVRSSWDERIRRNELGVHDQLYQDATRQHVASKSEDLDGELYQALIQNRQDIQENRKFLREISQAFFYQDWDQQTGNVNANALSLAINREKKLWEILDEKLVIAEVTIANHMEMHAQRAAMRSAFTANRQARSAGQLTKIATVIVPCTFVASIFSMGGSFAAGERLFYVYWLISIPVTVCLLTWVLHDWQPLFERFKESWTARRDGRRSQLRDEEKGGKREKQF
ncbi:hypothetical protein BU24DRAFT_420919 [Aaosphaeria arxii CBS 175.79]|uniref:Cora-domain-containing protein n=1 Tax=Aaosphaeria arxii CBS 175.79 TaxID=1450172 RepID=A0A6A5XYE8_9PLEO|nr:uncharacterized protein BU24DRAFT_420919 [Aaosphaeria arxii CBS 175.79]KAF2017857.1 hypothetical protein BU24DRAFT_420919 [Aaosphaeria arxii CBS 175.79]